jgi:hypothetical protein
MKAYLKSITAAVPAVFLAWVNGWTQLFKTTLLAPPNSDGSPDIAAAALATFIVVTLCYACRHWDDVRLRKYSFYTALAALIAVGGIFGLRFYLKYPRFRVEVETIYEVWTVLYIIFLILIVTAILFAVMSYLARPEHKRAAKRRG